MKVNMFIPEYMKDFKCISSKCVDTFCAGWDINIDENTFKIYKNSDGNLKELTYGKYKENVNNHDFFNRGYMILKDELRCPFLDDSMLCDIHGILGEKNLCITCKSYPRVYNIVDGIYEKSGLASCEELCRKSFLSESKIQFIECEEEINEDEIEIRRIIDTEAFIGSDNLLQYFWDIRIISINIIQNDNFSIDERLEILKRFYTLLQKEYENKNFYAIDELIEIYNNEEFFYKGSLKNELINFNYDIFTMLLDDLLINNIKSIRLKSFIDEYKKGITSNRFTDNLIIKKLNELKVYDYIFENYIVNQIFKDLIPFNVGSDLIKSSIILINSYKIIKSYIIGISTTLEDEIKSELIIRVIQSVSKDMEHNKVFKNLLESNL